MGYVALVLAGFLGCVFSASGLLKLFNLSATREAIAKFGVPAVLVPGFSTLLPFMEIVVGIGMAVGPYRQVSLLATLILLTVFTLAIVTKLIQGERPSCSCFGQLTEGTIGWTTVARNVLLFCLGIAALTALQFDSSQTMRRLADQISQNGSIVSLLALVAFMVSLMNLWLLLHLLAQYGRMVAALDKQHDFENVLAGQAAPEFALPDSDGRLTTLLGLDARSLLIIFTDASCAYCDQLYKSLDAEGDGSPFERFVIIGSGSTEILKDKMPSKLLKVTLFDPPGRVANLYHIGGTPSGIRIDSDGVVEPSLAIGANAIKVLLRGDR